MPDRPRQHTQPPKTPEKTRGANFDWQETHQGREALFVKIEQEYDHLNNLEQQHLLTFLLQHSTEDGIELARRLKLEPGELLNSFAYPGYARNHKLFLKTVESKMRANGNYMDPPNQEMGNNFFDAYQLAFEDVNKDPSRWKFKFKNPLIKQLAKEIDTYYLPFIARHQVREIKDVDSRTKITTPEVGGKKVASAELSGEQIGEQLLNKVEPFFNNSIYGSFARKTVAEKLRSERDLSLPSPLRRRGDDDSPRPTGEGRRVRAGSGVSIEFTKTEAKYLKKHLTPAEIDTLYFANMVPEEELVAMFKKLDIDADDETLRRRMKRHRPTMMGEIYNIQKSLATKDLKKEILEKLKAGGYPVENIEIIVDEATHKYVVRYKKGESEKEKKPVYVEKKEKMVESGFVRREVQLREKDCYDNFIQNKDFIVGRHYNEDGYNELCFLKDTLNILKDYYTITEMISSNGRLAFIGYRREDGRQVLVDGEEEIIINGMFDEEHLIDIDGKIVVKARKKGSGKCVVMYPGHHTSKEYAEIGNPIKINGEIVFWAKRTFVYGEFYIVHENGLEENIIDPLFCFDSDIVMEVGETIATKSFVKEGDEDKQRWNIVYPKDKVNTAPPQTLTRYKEAWSPIAVDGGLAFLAILDDNKQVVVFPNGEESDAFEEIKAIYRCDRGVIIHSSSGFGESLDFSDGVNKQAGVVGFGEIVKVALVNKGVYFAARMGNGKFYVHEDRELFSEIKDGFDTIEILQEQNGYFMVAGMVGDTLVSYTKKIGETKSAEPEKEEPESSKLEWKDFVEKPEIDLSKSAEPRGVVPFKDGVAYWKQSLRQLFVVIHNETYVVPGKFSSNVGDLVAFNDGLSLRAEQYRPDGTTEEKLVTILPNAEGNKVIVEAPPRENIDRFRELLNIDGEHYFVVQNKNKTFSIICDNERLFQEEFLEVGNPIKIGDRVVFWAKVANNHYVLKDAKSVVEGFVYFHSTEKLENISGGAIGHKKSLNNKEQWVVDYPNSFVSQEYPKVFDAVALPDGLAYKAQKENGKLVVVYPDGSDCEEWDDVEHFTKVGDGVAYLGLNGGLSTVVFPDGRSKKETNYVDNIFNINGETYYVLGVYGGWYVCNQTKSVFCPIRFDEIKVVAAENGYVVISGVVDGKLRTFSYKLDNGPAASGISDRGRDKSPQEEKEISLNAAEQRKLDLLNVIYGFNDDNHNTSEDIAGYKNKYLPAEVNKTWKDRTREFLSHSPVVAKTISNLIAEQPKLFVNSFSAKKDNLDPATIERLVYELFPEIPRNKFPRRAYGETGGYGAGAVYDAIPQHYLRRRDSNQLVDGDPLKKGAEVLELREMVNEFIVTQVYAKYNRPTNAWETVPFAVAPELDEPVKEYTFKLPAIGGLTEINLPVMLGAKVLTERVKGITANGEEVALANARLLTPPSPVRRGDVSPPLLTGEGRVRGSSTEGESKISVNSLGQVLVAVDVDKLGLTSIVYSQSRSELPATMPNISTKEYARYKKDFVAEHGASATEKIAELPEELLLFTDSIRDQDPKTQVLRIQKFVRNISYYDFDNGEVQGQKWGQSISEKLSFMERRLKELRTRKPELAKQLRQKKYAGVCADFAELTAALLREVGLVSGVASGFLPKDTSITTAEAHGIAYAAFPGADNKSRLIAVDGTPSGVTEEEQIKLQSIQQPSLAEREEEVEKIEEVLARESGKRLAEIQKILDSKDVTAISALANGELERHVNLVLKYGVKGSHVHVVETVLHALLYSSQKFSDVDLTSATEKISLHHFLASEIKREQPRAVIKGSERAGGKLMELMEDFIARISKESPAPPADVFQKLHTLLDLIHNDLMPDEQRALAAVITYLEARQMQKSG
ncbi:MAG: transglutaminase domain-containing protein [Candidatus Magasanikbacteria bacterium]|nr:transglutaminase domain-containing protein [Candidatus Magasanikbacteria bacterium]